ncbi:hypothetical protein QA601_16110 [Chitinispirillales bacterium ANBcel5]|uniref:hypothetical protein n=1 Tax=Cellulosispirillum alkaliphilum TaxID=3039283 RepID=UPI002A55DCE1|nr:hypothetical protein [Chitinispirillales bacterium ANBcel5]
MLKPSECTLFSGGHIGAETFFGECAEKWGVEEVTYSYEGHYIKREKNVVMLSDKELGRGDISMEIVSNHMHRQYTQSEKIKRVLQSIFHMINNSSQIFAVGEIMSDKTVRGGTGWGVELGKFFNRNVHVFDKNKDKWFTWRSAEWVEDEPLIIEPKFCGTGSRNLTEESQVAIEKLFERSFSA